MLGAERDAVVCLRARMLARVCLCISVCVPACVECTAD